MWLLTSTHSGAFQINSPTPSNETRLPFLWRATEPMAMANASTLSQTGCSQAQVPRLARRGASVATGEQVLRGFARRAACIVSSVPAV